MRMDNYFDNIFRNEHNIKETFKEIQKEIRVGNISEINDIIKRLLDGYHLTEDIWKIRLIIRSINACLNKDTSLELIKAYGNILLESIVSKDGNLRRLTTSLMDPFRLRLIFNIEHAKEGNIAINAKEMKSYNIYFYIKLSELYRQQEDDKIKKSIISSIKRFHCFAFDALISGTPHSKIYEEFKYYF